MLVNMLWTMGIPAILISLMNLWKIQRRGFGAYLAFCQDSEAAEVARETVLMAIPTWGLALLASSEYGSRILMAISAFVTLFVYLRVSRYAFRKMDAWTKGQEN
jgi:hypothetical protein